MPWLPHEKPEISIAAVCDGLGLADLRPMSKFAVGFEEPEHVLEPDARPAIGKAMPLLGRAAVRRVDSNLRRFVRRLHRGVQSSTWRKAVVVLSLEKEDRRLRVLDRVQPELPMAAIRMASTKGCCLSQAKAAI